VSPLKRRDEFDIRIRTGFAMFITGFVTACLLIMLSTDVFH
jgi:hypothetical protein